MVGLSIRPAPGRGWADCVLTNPPTGDLQRQPLGLGKSLYLSLGKHCVLVTFPSLVTFHPNPQWILVFSGWWWGGGGGEGDVTVLHPVSRASLVAQTVKKLPAV